MDCNLGEEKLVGEVLGDVAVVGEGEGAEEAGDEGLEKLAEREAALVADEDEQEDAEVVLCEDGLQAQAPRRRPVHRRVRDRLKGSRMSE